MIAETPRARRIQLTARFALSCQPNFVPPESIEQARVSEARDSQQKFVLGSMGPIFGDEAVEQTHGSQLRALIEAGVEALLFETLESLGAASALVRYANRFEACPPVVLHMSLWQHGQDGSWNIDPAAYVAEAVAAGASVVGVNCLAPWEAEAFVRSRGPRRWCRRG